MNIVTRLLERWFGLEPVVCISCETLRLLLEQERVERGRLTQALIDTTKPVTIQPVTNPEENKPIPMTGTPWRVRRQALEAEDREKARILRQHRESTEELEKKAGIETQPEQVEPVNA